MTLNQQIEILNLSTVHKKARILNLFRDFRNLHNQRINAYNNNWLTLLKTNNYPHEVVLKTLGKNGLNFKTQIKKNNLFNIYYDPNSKVIEFWGLNENNRITAIHNIMYILKINLLNYNKIISNAILKYMNINKNIH